MSIVYRNGEFIDADKACVSVWDRGFLFGDGIYEVVPVYDGRPLALNWHVERLQRSLREIGLRLEPEPDYQPMLRELLQLNGLRTASFYLQITRGAVIGKRDHAFPDQTTPSVFAFVSPWSAGESAPPASGISAITLPDLRWARCDIKAITLLPNAMARQQAREAGSDEALLLREGHVIEGSSSNVLALIAGVLVTPPEQPQMLSGITRRLILQQAREAGLDVAERPLPLSDVYAAEEVWISSSLREIKAVTRIDGRCIGKGECGPHWHGAMRRLRQRALQEIDLLQD